MSTTSSLTGNQLLAHGALAAGVQFVTGYPGSPATATLEALLDLADERVHIEWAINEKSAFDAAFAASLAGLRCLVCLKSVGLNVAFDSLMVSNLSGGDGGFVLLVGDDPGGWGSQNEEDSRPLAAAAEVPLLEPTCLADAWAVMGVAFDLSEQFRVPVLVRITRALAVDRCEQPHLSSERAAYRSAQFRRDPDRFNVLPIAVVDFHRRLQAILDQVQLQLERSALNSCDGQGRLGVIAAGYAGAKLDNTLAHGSPLPLRILRLGVLHPLPEKGIAGFLRGLDAALVLEETAPYVETQVQAIAQRSGLTLPIMGRNSGHLPRAGEILASHIAAALEALLRGERLPYTEPSVPMMPSRQPLCHGCPYIPTLEALLAVISRHGGRDGFVITGETGCMVRAQLPPWEILDIKYGMGSSIGLAAGLALSGIPQRIVALSGDSAFLHSGLGELIDAAQAGISVLVVLLANETTALSGFQPHPATRQGARGQPRAPVDLAALVRAAGVGLVRVIDPIDSAAAQAALEQGLLSDGVAVVIAQRACPHG